MNSQEWIILDTETSGLAPPIWVVDLAAQRMVGWEPVGGPFSALLNHNIVIPPEASRVNGYTRPILERDGGPPVEVHKAFAAYVAARPVASYNLAFDFDEVLIPEWRRLSVTPAGQRGFCLLRLAQRLLDPVPAGNCKLQTLRQYYRLPERAAHTAMGDVLTVIDLLQTVLRPAAEARGVSSWAELKAMSEEEWYPSRLGFGKFKGRPYTDASWDTDLRGWLQWLTTSRNARSARMGAWYLERLEQGGEPREPVGSVFCGAAPEAAEETEQSTGVALFQSPEREQLRALIERARGRLADLQAEYTTERRRVDAANAALYRLLQDHYLRRDRLRLIVDYRRRFLETLLNSGEDEAEEVSKGYRRARAETDREYQEAEREVARKVELSEAEMEELKRIYRMLAKLYHPDAHQNDPEKRAIYEKLMAAINKAKDEGAFDILSEIAADPEAFIAKQGWGKMDGARDESIEGLRRLYTALELEIIAQIEALSVLKESPEYEFMRLSGEKPEFLHNVAAQQRLGLIEEIEKLKIEAEDLANQIEELTGKASTI